MFNNYNPYYNYMQPQIPRVDPQFVQPQTQPNVPPIYKQNIGLQGKSVDSLEVVKAMDIPLDGSVSYFPLLDGSAIVTKQLQQDGTSKTIVYKPVENEKTEEQKREEKYITIEKFNEIIKDIDPKQFKELKEDMKTMKRQVRDLLYDIKDKKEE